MRYCLFIALFFASQLTYADCNIRSALQVQVGISEFAREHIERTHLAVQWVYAIDKLPETERLKMVTTYANMDACITGAAREILFYRKSKLMAIASPETGIRLVR